MATNQNDPDRPVIEDLGSGESDHGNPAAEVPNPEQLAQENRELRTKIGAMETQMTEMMGILQALRNGTAAENPAIPTEVAAALPPPNLETVTFAHTSGTNNQSPPTLHRMPWGLPPEYIPPGAEVNAGSNPPRVAERVQPISAANSGGMGTPQVQVQIPIPSGTPFGFHSPTTVHPQVQGPIPGNTTHSRDPHVNPAVVSMSNPHYGVNGFPQNYPAETPQARDRYHMLEERLRMIEGSSSRAREARDLCLIPDVVLPPKFKVPDFDKYRGVTCPKSHLTMYCRKMATHSHDDKLLIHYFQESLAGASLNWYMQLEPSHIHCWKDLADAFLRQYQYNMDMAPDRTQLQSMAKRDNESFKEYAQRWRALAAQVTPPLLEKELVFMFMETLPPLYYDRLIGSVSSNFSDMVIIGERLENGLRSGKIAHGSAGTTAHKKPFSGFSKKKEGETNTITISPLTVSPPYQPQNIPVPTQTQPTRPSQNNYHKNYQDRKQITFDPIPMSYTDLFNYLATNKLINTRPMKPVQPPYFRGYNPNITCAFHEGAVGHAVEDCKAFKIVVQDLIDTKGITFKQESPSITTNPLPGHEKPATNSIHDMGGQSLIKIVECIQTPLEVIHAELCKFGVIKRGCTHKEVCVDVNCAGACEAFKTVLQDLLDRHIIQIGVQEKEEDVLAFQSDKSRNAQKPMEIPYSQKPIMERPKTIVIPVPAPYQKNSAVPWSYGVSTPIRKPQVVPNVTNIAGSSGVTRSGRVYVPEVLKEGPSKEEEERIRKGKGIAQEPMESRKVSEQEATEFLKIMRQSDYKVVDQLHHTPAKISIMSLLLNSEAHRAALMKVLNEAHVAQNITVDQLDGIVGNIVASNYITFTDDELTPEGKGHNQALHISVRCGEYTLSRVLIDNGSSLNVMPKSTMSRLNVDCSYMKPSSTLVRAFDGSKKEVMGEMEFQMQIGPEVFYVNFQIMDIASSYSCLLGRPWIHAAGAVPSSLHQRLKFVVDDKLIVVFGEEEFIISKPHPSQYIEAAEESLESAFQSLEIANAAFVGEEAPLPAPKISNAAIMVAKIMLKNGYQIGKGLGKSEQGILTPVQLQEYKDRRGLGYWPTQADKKRMTEEKRERRLAKLQGWEPSLKKVPIYDLSQSFRSAGMLDPNQVAVIEEESVVEGKGVDLVRRSAADEELDNWKIIDFPVIFIPK